MKIEINKDERVLLMAALDLFARDEETGYVSDFYTECMELYDRLRDAEDDGMTLYDRLRDAEEEGK